MLLSLVWLSACRPRTQPAPSPQPSSIASLTLSEAPPSGFLAQIATWHPHDWRVHYLLGITAPNFEDKVAHLRRADSLNPQEPCIDYMLVLAHLEEAGESDDPAHRNQALQYSQAGVQQHPRHAALHLLHFYLLARGGEVPEARQALNIPDLGGGFCYDRLEEILIGLYDRAGRFNPYALMEMAEIYRSVPLPPFEIMMDLLYAIFLEPLERRPYDIRIRGRDAAVKLYNLGYRLRTSSQGIPVLFSDGYEHVTMGYMLQLKAAEFLTLHHRAFGDTLQSREVFSALMELQSRYLEYLSRRPWESSLLDNFFSSWEDLASTSPEMTLAEADSLATTWPLWRKAADFRYPVQDEPPAATRPD